MVYALNSFELFINILIEQLFRLCHNRGVMSRRNLTNVENFEFVRRFVEVCGSSQPAAVSRLLNISYQAAKNYLQGRLPDSNVLLVIARKTPYSVHWLLTGQGAKLVGNRSEQDTAIFSDEMKVLVRRECLGVIDEVLGNQIETAQPRVVVLTPDSVKTEKAVAESTALSKKHS